MADIRIKNLDAIQVIDKLNDVIGIEDVSINETRKITLNQISEEIAGTGLQNNNGAIELLNNTILPAAKPIKIRTFQGFKEMMFSFSAIAPYVMPKIFETGKNKFDKSSMVIDGYYFNTTTGVLLSSANFQSSLIPLSPNKDYVHSYTNNYADGVYHCFSDDGTYLGIATNVILRRAGNYSFKTLANTAFVGFIITNNTSTEPNSKDTVMVEEVVIYNITAGSAYESYKLHLGGNYAQNKLSVTVGKNLFNKMASYYIKDAYVTNSVGFEGSMAFASGWTCAYMMPILPNTQYTIQTQSRGVEAIFFDSSKVFISQSSGTGTVANKRTITTPANCAYMSFIVTANLTSEPNAGDNCQVELGATATQVEPFHYIFDKVYSKNVSDGSITKEKLATGLTGAGLTQDANKAIIANLTIKSLNNELTTTPDYIGQIGKTSGDIIYVAETISPVLWKKVGGIFDDEKLTFTDLPLRPTTTLNAIKNTFGNNTDASAEKSFVLNSADNNNDIRTITREWNDRNFNFYGEKNIIRARSIRATGNFSDYMPMLNVIADLDGMKSIGIDPSVNDTVWPLNTPKYINLMIPTIPSLFEGLANVQHQIWVRVVYEGTIPTPQSPQHYNIAQDIVYLDNAAAHSTTMKTYEEAQGKSFTAASFTLINTLDSFCRGSIYTKIPVYKKLYKDVSNGYTLKGVVIMLVTAGGTTANSTRSWVITKPAITNWETNPVLNLYTNVKNYPEDYQLPNLTTKNLKDVDSAVNPSSGQILTFNSATGKYQPQNGSIVETTNLLNADKILFFGCSYTESAYAIQNHSWIAKLSQLTNYNLNNQGVSGNRIVDITSRIRNNTPRYTSTGLGPKDIGAKYISIANIGNETMHDYGDGYSTDMYMEELREAVEAVYALGAKPIISTDHKITNNMLDVLLRDFAENNRILYHGLGTIGNYVIGYDILGFWGGGSHPATRTNAHTFLEWLYFVNQFPEPNKAIKIFRPRSDFQITDINSLNYDSILQRVIKWSEIQVGEVGLNEANTGWQYYDRLDESFSVVTFEDEYLKLIAKSNVAFTNYALFELILSQVKCTGAEIYIKSAISSGFEFWMKNNLVSTTWEPTAKTTACNFKVTKAIFDGFSETVDEIFTSTHTDVNLKYKGKYYSWDYGYLLCFDAVSTVVRTLNLTGTLTKVSNSATTAYLGLTNILHSYAFVANMYKPEGAYEQLAGGKCVYNSATGYWVITLAASDLIKYQRYDGLKLVMKYTGSFNISDIYISYSGGVPKMQLPIEVREKKMFAEKLSQTTFDADSFSSGGWTNSNASLVSIPVGQRDYPPITTTNYHCQLEYNAENAPQKISRTISLTGKFGYRKMVVKVVARVFPKIFNTTETPDTYFTDVRQIEPDSYDLGTLCLGISYGSHSYNIHRRLVDIGWSEQYFELLLPPSETSVIISLFRDPNDIIDTTNYKNHTFPLQICNVSVQVEGE